MTCSYGRLDNGHQFHLAKETIRSARRRPEFPSCEVSASGANITSWFMQRMWVTVIQGDVLGSADLERTVEGHDAVLSGFGPPCHYRKRMRIFCGLLPFP